MSNNLLLFEFMECDNASRNLQRNQRRNIRDQSDPFTDLGESDFIKRYRLSKQLVLDLCEELRPLFKKPVKSTDLSIETKMLITLSFYAMGSYQRPIGDISAHSVAQQTVSKIIAEVTTIIDSPGMRKKYICFPRTPVERNKIRARFYENFNFPGVLGCIDCTQVAIIRPAKYEERYYCRKHYHSLNVQLICDADMQFTSVDASYGGATHDSFIWNMHPIKSHLENLNESSWLLGDSGYPLRKYLMTPIINAVTGTPESHYTDIHVRTRNTIERAIGLLKARFRCLLVHRVLHYDPKTAAHIINACVILHNICNRANTPVHHLSDEDLLQESQMQSTLMEDVSQSVSVNNEALHQGLATRNSLIRRLWDSN